MFYSLSRYSAPMSSILTSLTLDLAAAGRKLVLFRPLSYKRFHRSIMLLLALPHLLHELHHLLGAVLLDTLFLVLQDLHPLPQLDQLLYLSVTKLGHLPRSSLIPSFHALNPLSLLCSCSCFSLLSVLAGNCLSSRVCTGIFQSPAQT
jgi:hypothetical protein